MKPRTEMTGMPQQTIGERELAKLEAACEWAQPGSKELLGECITLLREILKHEAENLGRPWEKALFKIGSGSMMVFGRPFKHSPVVRAITLADLAWDHRHPEDPECDALRILVHQRPKVDAVLAEYEARTGVRPKGKCWFAWNDRSAASGEMTRDRMAYLIRSARSRGDTVTRWVSTWRRHYSIGRLLIWTDYVTPEETKR